MRFGLVRDLDWYEIQTGIRDGGDKSRPEIRTGTRLRLVRDSDWYETQTGTRFRLVRDSDWYETQTGTRFRLVRDSDWYEIHTRLYRDWNYVRGTVNRP
jgi:hypothetical protein